MEGTLLGNGNDIDLDSTPTQFLNGKGEGME